ncbi:MAG: hypothetical protein KME42_13915 [Tildeniella nuda ZEHNDER 1965/U140]|jgi:hypothetical protein|nr:hypothetical protein [Tildeniella nuda ZEHNDER 1965/U140]
MDAKTLAALLDGRQMGDEITKEEEAIAKEHSLVVAFGYSDDNVEFRGAIDDEVGAYDGAEVAIVNGAIVTSKDELAFLAKYPTASLTGVRKVTATWEPEGLDASWLIDTEGGEPFDIYEDEKLFCRGMVFKL